MIFSCHHDPDDGCDCDLIAAGIRSETLDSLRYDLAQHSPHSPEYLTALEEYLGLNGIRYANSGNGWITRSPETEAAIAEWEARMARLRG